MNILRLSTLSLTLAIAVMTLGVSADGWAAPKCDTPPCGGGKDKTETVFMVEMHPGTEVGEDGLVTSAGVDCGTTEDSRDLGVTFPEGCVTVSPNFITEPIGAPLTLRLFTLGVRANRSEAQLFFSDVAIPSHGPVPNESVYVISGLPVTISPTGPITVTVNLSDLGVIKAHQPRKGDLVGPIAIGEIVYTPN